METYYGRYFDWLCELINLKPGTYDILIHELYAIEFTWTIELDANRADDGIVLRGEFHDYSEMEEQLRNRPCSVLEALIALAIKFDYTMDDEDRGDRTRIWFWEMIDNLGLGKYDDLSFNKPFGEDMFLLNDIRNICYRWMNREFSYAGRGSPFPLFNPKSDQRKLHLIRQMNDYILEKYIYDDEIL